MVKIGTHNSATGEPSGDLLSLLVSPFCKCQSKSIVEQYESGCRYFDLRVRYQGNEFYCCHGIWKSKTSFKEILLTLMYLATRDNEKVYVMVTYEGEISQRKDFIRAVKDHIKGSCLTLTEINVKKPTWTRIHTNNKSPKYVQGYKSLDGSSWHTYLPIPWIWDKVFFYKEKLNNNTFTFIDFL